jgi:hypothetical protein
MYLININDVKEVEQKITTTVFLKLVWFDTFMEWDPIDYGNLTEFSIPQDEIWKPDIALANAFDTISGLGDKFMYVTVTNDGKISWEPFQRFVSTCSLRMKYFPFDTHVCDIQMATWSSTKQMINIITGSDGFNIDFYEENANWNLLNVSTYDSSTVATSGLSFSLKITRKPIYYILNTIFPIVLLSLLNNFVFVLPCSSGEKLSFAIILFLSFAIFLLIVTEIMPEGVSSMPLVTIYLLLESIFSTLIVLITIVQLRLHNRSNKKPVPKLFRKYTKFVQELKRRIFGKCFYQTKASDKNVKVDEYQGKRFVSSIEDTMFDTKPTTTNENLKRSVNDSNERGRALPLKRILICGANKIHSADEIDEIKEEDMWRTKMGQLNNKTAFKLADILGHSNRVEPEAFFNKPADVGPIYNPNTNTEDEMNVQTLENNVFEDFQNSKVTKTFLRTGSVSSASISSTTNSSSKDEITWPEFILALDNTLFVMSVLINTITTIVTLSVSMSN